MVAHAMEMEPELRQRIDEFLVTSLLEHKTSLTTPFADGRCRHELYKAMATSITTPTPRQASCLSYAVRLFTTGLQDPVFEIRQSCQVHLALCDQLIRPQTVTVTRRSEQMVPEDKHAPGKHVLQLQAIAPVPQPAGVATDTGTLAGRKRKLSVSEVDVQVVDATEYKAAAAPAILAAPTATRAADPQAAAVLPLRAEDPSHAAGASASAADASAPKRVRADAAQHQAHQAPVATATEAAADVGSGVQVSAVVKTGSTETVPEPDAALVQVAAGMAQAADADAGTGAGTDDVQAFPDLVDEGPDSDDESD